MELTEESKNKVLTLLNNLGVSADAVTFEVDGETLKISVNVDENEAGMYIGRFASTIDSIQLIISLMLRSTDSNLHVLLDIGGYRSRRSNTLQEMVDRISSEVLSTGVARALPPISSTERREVHLLLSNHDTLTTYSEGEGRGRRLFIALRQD